MISQRLKSASVILPLSLGLVLIVRSRADAATYYVSPGGNDNSSGLAPSSPWQTLGKVNSASFAPGDSILFQRGSEWHESLVASSSGLPNLPITYDAYGTGAKPRFWGSDVLDKSAFQLQASSASTFWLSSATPVNSVLVDHQFTHSASLLTGSSDATTNLAYVNSNPNTWFYDSDKLYLNTGGINPATDSRTYTAAVREDAVDSNYKNHLVFRNLVADETAKYNSGYAFRIQFSDDVLVENSEAYRAGKHHFGVINSTNFVGRHLYAGLSMPDQGYGGASPYVSYSGDGQSDTSTWIDVTAENPYQIYPGFISHGAGIHALTIQNMVVRGGGVSLALESPTASARVEGGSIDNAALDLYGNNITVDGVKITGPYGAIGISGQNNLIQNNLLVGRQPNWWGGQKAAIVEGGTDNIIRFNTIILGPVEGPGGGAIAITNSNSNSEIYANAFADPHAIVFFGPPAPIRSHDNLFAPNSEFWRVYSSGFVEIKTLAQWQAMGYDLNSDKVLLGDANFDGKIDQEDYALIEEAFLTHNADARYQDGDFDFSGGPPNADDFFIIDRAFFEQPAEELAHAAVPEPAAMALFSAATCLIMRRRRDPLAVFN
jgi:hypothetical protein